MNPRTLSYFPGLRAVSLALLGAAGCGSSEGADNLEGLLRDGELTQLLTHPSHGVIKTYLAEVEGLPTPGALAALRDGVELDDGVTAPASVRLVQRRGGSAAGAG